MSIMEDATPDTEAYTLAINALNLQVETLNAECQALRERNATLSNQLHEANMSAARVMNIVSDELTDQADRRGWCSDYDEIIEKVNGQIIAATGREDLTLNERFRDWSLDIDMFAHITASITVEVRAKTLEDAEQLFRHDPEAYVNEPEHYLVRNGDINDISFEVV